ncbi:MAG TPA: ComEA family DNA-binding protein [Anaerolineaceae bacterium]|nr:ComEA family DNA-binding protein [Anaerolineaceae bacterium]HPN53291.1 ComEA family DNA-binding protein [Anaerolineaceae bacterium]
MKSWHLLALGIVLGLLAAGVVAVAISPPRGQPIMLTPPPSPAPLMVHVTGAVENPGVYALPAGSRLQDAINAAGGLLPGAKADQLNLASPVKDGERVFVPVPAATLPARSVQIWDTPAPTLAGVLNINTATVEELDGLPGIGPSKAEAIIQYRQQNGLFTDIEQLKNVPGIGESIFSQIKDRVTVQ